MKKKIILILTIIVIVILWFISKNSIEKFNEYKNINIETFWCEKDTKHDKIKLFSSNNTLCMLEYIEEGENIFAKVYILQKHFLKMNKLESSLKYNAEDWLLTTKSEQILYDSNYNITSSQNLTFGMINNFECAWESPQFTKDFPCLTETVVIFECRKPEINTSEDFCTFEYSCKLNTL